MKDGVRSEYLCCFHEAPPSAVIRIIWYFHVVGRLLLEVRMDLHSYGKSTRLPLPDLWKARTLILRFTLNQRTATGPLGIPDCYPRVRSTTLYKLGCTGEGLSRWSSRSFAYPVYRCSDIPLHIGDLSSAMTAKAIEQSGL